MGTYGSCHRKGSKGPVKYSKRIYVKVPRREIGYFKFLLESYENLCYMSVVDRFEAIIKISFLSYQQKEVERFLDALKKDIGLEEALINQSFLLVFS